MTLLPASVSGTGPRGRLRGSGVLQAGALALVLRVVSVGVLAVVASASGHTAHQRLVRWDANWYAGIAAHDYGFTRTLADGRHLSDYAFFPLYPALENVVHRLTGLGYKDCGLAISWVLAPVAAAGVFAVGRALADRRTGLVLAGLWSALPTAFVLSMAYSEALFVALAAWSLYAVLGRRWILGGLLAALAGLTRPIGGALAVAIVVAAALHLAGERPAGTTADREPRWPVVTGALLSFSGLAAYVGWVGWRRHDLFGYFAVQNGWGNGFDGGRAFSSWLWHLITDVAHPVRILAGLLVILGVLGVFALFGLAVRDRLPPVLLVYSGVLIVLGLCTARYFGSKPRYLFPAFPLLLPIAAMLVRRRPLWRSPTTWAVAIGLVTASAAGGAVILLGSAPP